MYVIVTNNASVVYTYTDRQTDQETEKRAPKKILVYLELYMTEMARQISGERLFKLVIHIRKEQLDPYCEPCTKFNSKWIKDLEVKNQNF